MNANSITCFDRSKAPAKLSHQPPTRKQPWGEIAVILVMSLSLLGLGSVAVTIFSAQLLESIASVQETASTPRAWDF